MNKNEILLQMTFAGGRFFKKKFWEKFEHHLTTQCKGSELINVETNAKYFHKLPLKNKFLEETPKNNRFHANWLFSAGRWSFF